MWSYISRLPFGLEVSCFLFCCGMYKCTVVVTVVVVVSVGGVPSILKLSFMVIGVFLGSRVLLGMLLIAIVVVCALQELWQHCPATSFDDSMNNVVEEEDGGWVCFLGGNNSSGTKKYQGSNSGDGGNTEDGVKIAGGVIGSGVMEIELNDMLSFEAGK
ncbi:hypothetical protein Tco_0496759 [Tanacetum coccineum]